MIAPFSRLLQSYVWHETVQSQFGLELFVKLALDDTKLHVIELKISPDENSVSISYLKLSASHLALYPMDKLHHCPFFCFVFAV